MVRLAGLLFKIFFRVTMKVLMMKRAPQVVVVLVVSPVMKALPALILSEFYLFVAVWPQYLQCINRTLL